jgi:predicted lipoprotein with Yx(FWY)xxD motif
MTKSVLRLEAGKRSRTLVSLAVAGATAAALTAGGATVSSASSAAGPSGSAQISATAASSRPAAVVELTVRRTALGTILTDGRGFTLYAFAADRGTRSRCTGACARVWPPLTVITRVDRIRVGRGVAKSRVGTTVRAGRLRQLTYAGHPLYRFSGDRRPTQTRGQGVRSFGARWAVLTPAGRVR